MEQLLGHVRRLRLNRSIALPPSARVLQDASRRLAPGYGVVQMLRSGTLQWLVIVWSCQSGRSCRRLRVGFRTFCEGCTVSLERR